MPQLFGKNTVALSIHHLALVQTRQLYFLNYLRNFALFSKCLGRLIFSISEMQCLSCAEFASLHISHQEVSPD